MAKKDGKSTKDGERRKGRDPAPLRRLLHADTGKGNRRTRPACVPPGPAG
ncbi:hypothetical protein HEP84_38150 [Streptomyces sp. RLB1-33]|nr:hypothetical protein [Streptomyces sp. RLB1-33]QIY74108.1 hypothetical protein HEP84_38150 [Streptomyces sp. RLB1-33]